MKNTKWILLLSLVAGTANAQLSTHGFTYQGQIAMNTAASLPTNATIRFNVYAPSSNCLLYSEERTNVNLLSTVGHISVVVGTGPRTGTDPGHIVARVFSNDQGALAGASPCPYTPAPGDGRRLEIIVNGEALTPMIAINHVPRALVAQVAETLSTNAISGDATIDSSKNLHLKNTGAAAGTYGSATQIPVVTVDAKGRITAVSVSAISGGGGGTLSGDVTGPVGSNTLSATGVSAATYTKVTVDSKGRVTNGANLAGADIVSALGFTPMDSAAAVSGALTVGANAPLVSSGGANPVISISQASSSSAGYLSAADWNIFNSKLSNVTNFAGDISGSFNSLVIAPQAVSFGKIQNLSGNNILLGRHNSGAGSVEEITIGSGLSLSGNTLSSTGSGGTVTAVSVSAPAFMSVSGSPITTTGTIGLGFNPMGQNMVFASPVGSSGNPGFRNLQMADIKSSVTGDFITGSSCTGGQALTYSTVTDSMSCTPIVIPMHALGSASISGTLSNGNYAQTWNWSGLNTNTGLKLAHTTGTLSSGSIFAVAGGTSTYNSSLVNFSSNASSATGAVLALSSLSSSGKALLIDSGSTSGVPAVQITASGNGGVGLKIEGNTGAMFELENTSASGKNQILFNDNSGSPVGLVGYGNPSTSGYPAPDIFTIGTMGSRPLVLGSNGNPRMHIDPGGNVGINNGAPIAKLHVQGTITTGMVNIPTGGAINGSSGNFFRLQSVGGTTITLSNQVDGATYKILITDTTSRTYTFSGCTVSKFSPANAATTASMSSIYNVTTVWNGSSYDCYIDWKTGYN